MSFSLVLLPGVVGGRLGVNGLLAEKDDNNRFAFGAEAVLVQVLEVMVA